MATGNQKAKAQRAGVQSEEASKTDAERQTAEEAAKAEAERLAATSFLVVTGPAKGRRRVGRSFGPVAVAVPLVELSDDDIAAIEADPELASHREEGEA